jgi:hypothetical protein
MLRMPPPAPVPTPAVPVRPRVRRLVVFTGKVS